MQDLSSAPPPPLRDEDRTCGDTAREAIFFYADFTCPRCALAYERLTQIDAHIVFRHMALRAKDERALPAACAAEAAAAQRAFWPFADALYADQGRLDDPHLWERARTLGLDVERFDADRRGSIATSRVQRETREALAAGATTTPMLFAAGIVHPGVPDGDLLARLGYPDQVRIQKTS